MPGPLIERVYEFVTPNKPPKMRTLSFLADRFNTDVKTLQLVAINLQSQGRITIHRGEGIEFLEQVARDHRA